MKTKYSISEKKTLNTNEMINDYVFYYQMICEEMDLDFDNKL
jgi:hypothetical protein